MIIHIIINKIEKRENEGEKREKITLGVTSFLFFSFFKSTTLLLLIITEYETFIFTYGKFTLIYDKLNILKN